MLKRLLIIEIVILMLVLPFSVIAATIPYIVFTPTSTASTIPATAEPAIELQQQQQLIYDHGYNYTVAENWITLLSHEDRNALCGYEQLTAPDETVSEKVIFFSGVPTRTRTKTETLNLESLPSSYDAMALGYVTPVKDQGACGSCWLFAAAAELESRALMTEGVEFEFS